jgi:acyl-coenzyme A synthetase/AMP-(fatty) acid ligase
MSTLPLLPDSPGGGVLAYRNGRAVSRDEFLHEVLALADRLPKAAHVLNMCMDRYWFAVGFFAAISRGIVSVLPNSPAPEHIASLCAGTPSLFCLSDQELPPSNQVPYLRIGQSTAHLSSGNADLPQIPFDQCIARLFTSGSTGEPQAHSKTFGRMQLGANAEAERMWSAAKGPCTVLGTVPFRHMYGLESTVLLPILGGGRLCTRTPFFPADIASALAELPAPRFLVTTPFHLRKLLDADIEIPTLAAILSATAPLSRELASSAEARLGAPMMEIYGSTETGQIATRRPSSQLEWETYSGIKLHQERDETIATGGHLECAQVLNDTVGLSSPTIFRLIDRNSNMINIAGKRSSLAFLNHTIISLSGVRDAAFCVPDSVAEKDVARLAAFVVAPELSPADILAALRPHLDPVFLPRPIIALAALPRDGNGKLSAAAMAALIAEHITAKN